ncbi:DUF6522 family protein [Thalassococcus sp. S3]|uniref:DUF6522 family protein n=1 Tax=Thalassococcus sp. S3 TaxID=2017482 RepID=UPI0010242D35|nr:DUF6522 family protein [Thalassococcus sp. S3]QBF33956.1 hypothetical protein CFI11_22510 [Thalassococcus sp. S3]
MSEEASRLRIRAQASARDPSVMGFILDAPLTGADAHFASNEDAPLPRTLRGIAGVGTVEVSNATIWVRKTEGAAWPDLKPSIAAGIRAVLSSTPDPLGSTLQEQTDHDPDAVLLSSVRDLLDRQVNPSVAAHGGHIEAEKVENGTVFLRMSGGCQGCAASAATLREGVERMLRAALPDLQEIVDVTDHEAGSTPYYARESGTSPVFERPVPAGALNWNEGQVMVDPDFLAPRLGLTPDALRAGLQNGDVVGVTETGTDADAGKTRIILRSSTRAWAAEIDTQGHAREIPPPKVIDAASGAERKLAARIRAYLMSQPGGSEPLTYRALARAIGLWAPGSVRKITKALEATMRDDARANRPFLAARVVSRAGQGLPGQGFFDLARSLSRGPEESESDRDFHMRELQRLEEQRTVPDLTEPSPR